MSDAREWVGGARELSDRMERESGVSGAREWVMKVG